MPGVGPPPGEESERSNLYRRLGGAWAVDVAAEVFYRKILWDERIAHFFDGVDIDRQIAKQVGFLTMVFGGPPKYTGRGLQHAHRHLVDRGLTDEHFDVVVELLTDTLTLMGARPDDVAEVAKIVESLREDVLGRRL